MFLPNALRNRFSAGGLRARVLRGSAWTTVGFALDYAMRLGSTMVLTRLLMPEAFGLMSLAVVFQGALALLSDLGTETSVVRSSRGDDPDFLRTAWSIQMLRGLGIAATLCLLAWPISLVYDQALLFPLLCVLSLSSVVAGFNSISLATCRRRLDVYSPMIVSLVSQFAGTLVTIFFAWWLQSVWALAIGSVCASLLRLLMSHVSLPAFDHRFQLEKPAVTEIVTFGRWILLGTFMTYLSGQGNKAIMGLLLPLDTLGFIHITTTLSWAVGRFIARVLQNVGLPSLSIIARERPQDLSRGVRKIQRAVVLAVLPVFFFLSFGAQWIVDLLYNDDYAVVGQYLSLFALNGAINVLSMPYQNAMLSLGDSRAHAFVMTCSAILRISGIFIGFYLGDVFGMIAGLGAGQLIVTLISAGIALRRGFANPMLDLFSLSITLFAYAYTLSRLMTPSL